MSGGDAPGYARIGALYRILESRWPTGLDDLHRDMMAAQIADCEANTAAALALFVQGQGGDAMALVGATDHTIGIPLTAAFASAGDALVAAIAKSGERGPLVAAAALQALQARSADFRAANELLMTKHAESGNV